MHIGIAFDLKADRPAAAGLPDDWQEEFDSPVTINAIAAVLRARGHTVTELGDGRGLVEKLLADPPDLVFNIAEGEGIGRSREARVPAVCEMLGVPYTGSDPSTLAAALDKGWARQIVAAEGVKVPDGCVVTPAQLVDFPHRPEFYPRIVKPAWEGSSKGICRRSLARTPRELHEAVYEIRDSYKQPVVVEEFIDGDELTVGVVGNGSPRVLGVMRVIPTKTDEPFVYSLEVKRNWIERVRYECPARLAENVAREVMSAARDAYLALGCRDVARIDFRLRRGVPYFIEANPLPGLNPDASDLVFIANFMGISYEQLIGMILDAAMERIESPPVATGGL
jgi:D-alanine-D-alanine ligase